MPRFIVDECTGVAVTRFLRDQGYDAISVNEIMPQADDHDILQRATLDERVVVTNDKDFGDMVYRDRLPHKGILLLRLADDRTETKLRVLTAVIKQYLDTLEMHFVVATEKNIRVRSFNQP